MSVPSLLFRHREIFSHSGDCETDLKFTLILHSNRLCLAWTMDNRAKVDAICRVDEILGIKTLHRHFDGYDLNGFFIFLNIWLNYLKKKQWLNLILTWNRDWVESVWRDFLLTWQCKIGCCLIDSSLVQQKVTWTHVGRSAEWRWPFWGVIVKKELSLGIPGSVRSRINLEHQYNSRLTSEIFVA